MGVTISEVSSPPPSANFITLLYQNDHSIWLHNTNTSVCFLQGLVSGDCSQVGRIAGLNVWGVSMNKETVLFKYNMHCQCSHCLETTVAFKASVSLTGQWNPLLHCGRDKVRNPFKPAVPCLPSLSYLYSVQTPFLNWHVLWWTLLPYFSQEEGVCAVFFVHIVLLAKMKNNKFK